MTGVQTCALPISNNDVIIRGAIPGSKGDYVIIREAKKRPKGWKPAAARVEKKADAKKK